MSEEKHSVSVEEFEFLSQDNRTKIHGKKWIPTGQRVLAVFQITHGMQEYIERYEKFAEYLAKKGFLVVGHDHLGHGRSVRSRSELGYFAKEWGRLSDILILDMHQVHLLAKREYPNVPYFILGHSMGSYLLRKYLTRYSGEVDGAIICGTGTESDVNTYFGMALCRLLGELKGDHYRSNFVRDQSFGKPYAAFDKTGRDPGRSWLSKNERSVRAYYKDPLCQFDFTVNGYYMLFSVVNYDNHMRNIRKTRRDLPMLFLSGAEDPVGHGGQGVRIACRKYARAGIRDLKLKLYAGDRHEILQETDREQVFEDIYHWCRKRMGRGKGAKDE